MTDSGAVAPNGQFDGLNGATILVVDDEPVNVTLLGRILKRAGETDVVGTTDPREALELVDAHPPDLVLLDLHMPYLDGIELMGHIQERLPQGVFVPIVILTADTADTSRQRALEGGASDFLTKPFDRMEVLLRVANLLERRRLHEQVRSHAEDLEGQVAERTRELTRTNEELESSRRELERLYERAVELDRVKSDFVAVASHEVRTPVTVIAGFAELLVERGESMTPEQRRISLERLNGNAQRLERLLKNLLAAARVEVDAETVAIRSTMVDVAGLVEKVMGALPMEGEVDLQVDPGLTVSADQELLEQIVVNLLTNAQRHGGFPITVTSTDEGDAVALVVADQGPGVREEYLPRLFTRFARVDDGDRQTSGVGLGLWIVARLAQMHGGEAFHEPNRPNGARFGVRLPRR